MSKKIKKKKTPFLIAYKKRRGYHVYRSAKKDAPFSEWTRLTEKPLKEPRFQDKYEKGDDTLYFYKMTEVDVYGNESEPLDPTDQYWFKDGEKIPRKPETTPYGINSYWSEDPDLPLDQWKKINDEVVTESPWKFKPPIKTPFYMYSKYVNELGEEYGTNSTIQRVEPVE